MVPKCANVVEIFIKEWHTLIIGERQCREGTLDQYFGGCYNLYDAANIGPWLGGHPVAHAQDGGIAHRSDPRYT